MKKYIKYIIVGVCVLVVVLTGVIINAIGGESNSEGVIEEVETDYVVSYIYVDLKGEVKYPGVYRVTTTTRLFEVVELAGGLTINAYTKNINLAQVIEDEKVYLIPGAEDLVDPDVPTSDLININTATEELLDTLPGIGSQMAKNIIEYRTKIGLFSSIEEIKNVSGIGDAIFEKIKENIIV